MESPCCDGITGLESLGSEISDVDLESLEGRIGRFRVVVAVLQLRRFGLTTVNVCNKQQIGLEMTLSAEEVGLLLSLQDIE